MENDINDLNALESNKSLSITNRSLTYLSEIGRWTKFLAILGFVFVGFMVVFALFAGSAFSQLGEEAGMPIGGGFISVLYILMAMLYFFPLFYLYKFASNIKDALTHKNEIFLDGAFENLKSHYKFIGIFTIVILSFYLLIGAGALLMTSML